MSKTVYRFWCEWDLGLDETVFETKELAWKFGERAVKIVMEVEDFDALKDDGLVGVDPLLYVEGE